jgi:Na+/H+ antiporter NhaD/arsenite permease-like protein
LMAFLAPVTLVLVIALQWIVPWILPSYEPALRAMQVMLIASLLDCILVARVSFVVAKAWKSYAIFLAAMAVTFAAGSFGGFYVFEDRLLGVAIGRLLGGLVIIPVAWWLVPRKASGPAVEQAPQAVKEGVDPLRGTGEIG